MVINGKAGGRVSASTQQRVNDAVGELGYVVDSAASSLVTGRRNCVALVAPDVGNPFFSQVASGVAAALGQDYRLLLAVSGPERDEPDLQQLVAFGVDGILLDFAGSAAPIGELDCPGVLLDEPAAEPEGDDVCRVHFDTGTGARQLVEAIVGLGHRTVAYLDAARAGETFTARRREVLAGLEAAGCAEVAVLDCAIDIDTAHETVLRCWPDWRQRGVTAIVAASDVLAYGALRALGELGVRVPGEVSLGSFDDLPFSTLTSPPLTTVRLSAFDLGHRGALALRALIEDGEAASVSLETTLVHRSSLGPPR